MFKLPFEEIDDFYGDIDKPTLISKAIGVGVIVTMLIVLLVCASLTVLP